MGTQLYERGVLYSACFEELNLSRDRELVAKVHDDYLRAGANCLETNTFGANSLCGSRSTGCRTASAEINAAAVKLAREAAARHRRMSSAASGRRATSSARPARRI